MGLIAREIEARGIPTLSLSSALSITRSVNPPRAAFVDYPLGHTSGKPHQPELQRKLILDALNAFESLAEPGGVVTLPHAWADDDSWKDDVMRSGADAGGDAAADDRAARDDSPQYEREADRLQALAALDDGGCRTCVFLAES